MWNKILLLADQIETLYRSSGTELIENINHYNWYNRLFTSDLYRRAHIQIVDFRESHGIYILHSTVFPHTNDPSPIWGFDIVASNKKITGAFLDFSMPGYSNHPISSWWETTSEKYNWSKDRKLPEWAQSIFSKDMVAAGNIQEDAELDILCNLALDSLKYYLTEVGKPDQGNYVDNQNFYCKKQKENPHVIRSMVSMGVPANVMESFVHTTLFPEIQI
jgi:hypothetical protein